VTPQSTLGARMSLSMAMDNSDSFPFVDSTMTQALHLPAEAGGRLGAALP